MDMVGPSCDAFRLDEMAEHYGVDVCCVSWQTQEGGWTRVTNNQTIVSVEQMDASKLHKFLFTRLAPTFYEDMTKISSISSDPLVAQHPKFRFYAEALFTDDHERLFGSVSIAHRSPKSCKDIGFPDAGWLKEVRDLAITFKPDDSFEYPSLLRSLRTSTVPHKTDGSSEYLSFSTVPHKTDSSSGYPALSMGLLPRKSSGPLLVSRSATAASAASISTQSEVDCERPSLAARNYTASSVNSWEM
eukprot:TRINITY_DN1406_c0_g1_i1.p1 TRINITY_DN1406_c0_g1~~TRINITY_DN1406_c0_g1_i1.p1  ORF type:complete len:245 (+),score=36.30 TRINITY_DN1406_c0_g1_i1:85-819(+)